MSDIVYTVATYSDTVSLQLHSDTMYTVATFSDTMYTVATFSDTVYTVVTQ